MKAMKTLLAVGIISALSVGTANAWTPGGGLGGILGNGTQTTTKTLNVTRTMNQSGAGSFSSSGVSGNAVNGVAVSAAANLSTAGAMASPGFFGPMAGSTGGSVSIGGGYSTGKNSNAGYSAYGEASAYADMTRMTQFREWTKTTPSPSPF